MLSYSHYTRCRHALCGVHLLRELTYFEELGDETKAWAAPLKNLLLEMKERVEREREGGGARLDAPVLAELSARYDRLVTEGQAVAPPPELPEGVRKQARNLLLRFERRRAEVLLFLTDFSVPFDRYERRSQRQRSTVPPPSSLRFDGPLPPRRMAQGLTL